MRPLAHPCRLPGTCHDRETKRLYLARLRAAQARYDAAMARPRRRSSVAKVALQTVGEIAEAFARFELARDRAERGRVRRRLQAARWLARQDDPHAFRPRHPRLVSEARA